MSLLKDIATKFKTHAIYLVVILIVLAFFSIREMINQKNNDDLIDKISTYSDSARYYKGKNGEVVAFNNVLKVNNEEQLRSLLSTNEQIRDEIKKFKSLRDVTTIKTYTVIHDTIPIPANSIPCDFKPFPITKLDKNYTFKATLSKNDFVIDSLIIPNDISIIIGKRKVGFMKYEEQVTVKNSNPYVNTTNLSNISVKHEKKWWDRGIVKFGAGFVVGYGASTVQRAMTK